MLSFLEKDVSQGSVTVEFDIQDNDLINEKLKQNGLNTENQQILLRRILYNNGKSKAFINDNPVTVGLLQEIGSALIEIHGQNEKIGLLDSGLHMKLLDKYGEYNDLLEKGRKSL